MQEEKFHIELSLIREDEQEGRTTDAAITVVTTVNEESAGRLFKLCAKKLGGEI